jgi:hypothetical protein
MVGYPTGFHGTSMMFPTEGCWEGKAKAGKKELRTRVWRIAPSDRLMAISMVVGAVLLDRPRLLALLARLFGVLVGTLAICLAFVPGLWGRWMWGSTLGPWLSWRDGERIVWIVVALIVFVLAFRPFLKGIWQRRLDQWRQRIHPR